MPQKDLSNVGGLVADLWRETSFAVFFCTLGGMLLGVIGSIAALLFWFVAMASMIPAQGQVQGAPTGQPTPVVVPVGRGPGVVAFLIVVPGAVVGGVLGCLFGVLIDFLVNLVRGPKKKRVGKKWDPEREAARRERRRRPPPEDKGDVGEHWNPSTNYQQRPED